MRSGSGAHAGFTMIELAMALFLMALLLGSLAIPVQTQVELRKVEQTERILDAARTRVAGLRSRKRLSAMPRR